MLKHLAIALVPLLLCPPLQATEGQNAQAEAAARSVYFVTPKDGAKVRRKLKVKFGQKGVKVRRAGEAVDDLNFGHHHLIIDGGPVPKGTVVPADANHIHYGKGQLEAEIELPPGAHKLTLQFADGAHRSMGEEMSATINVTVR
jgi:hypothetical protein